ncbi:hypothetical protein QSH57_004254 [Fusarium oxysporum f. sp. vasinfectum]|nr:hypothetical protein QSH57_004254 [Fusarium oxysporum f. sp. vasinfectum]
MAANPNTFAHPEFRAGVVLERTQTKDGYNLVQKEHTDALRRDLPDGTPTIDWALGPVRVRGYVNPTTFGITVSVDVSGINLGTLRGDLKNGGLMINLNLFVANGEIKLFLKNGNEVWIRLHLKVTFDGTFDKEVKLIEI